MDKKTIRQWVDEAGVQVVAARVGVGVDTVSRWATGHTIPATRESKVDEEFYRWKAEQAAKGQP